MESLGLLKAKPDGNLAPPDEHIGVWPDQGPLVRLIKEKWMAAVLREATFPRAGAKDSDFALRYYRLSQKSAKDFRQKMLDLIDDFQRISLIESKIHDSLSECSFLYALVNDSVSNIRQRSKLKEDW